MSQEKENILTGQVASNFSRKRKARLPDVKESAHQENWKKIIKMIPGNVSSAKKKILLYKKSKDQREDGGEEEIENAQEIRVTVDKDFRGGERGCYY